MDLNRHEKRVLLTFGGGGKHYIEAGKRLIEQGRNTGHFDETILVTDEDLKKDPEFWDLHSEFIRKSKRGCGYWLWKPYIIRKMMNKLQDGDIVLYADAGCEIVDKKRTDLIPSYFNYVKTDKIIGTLTKQPEKRWNKMDLVEYLNMENHPLYLNSQQRQAGLLLIEVCEQTRFLLNEWYKVACNYHMIDDTPSISQNCEIFKEHRHDQSIYSLLTKKQGIYTTKYSLDKCVIYCRNKSGKSKFS